MEKQKNLMFNKKEEELRYGNIKRKPELKNLISLEKIFIEESTKLGLKAEYDIHFNEEDYFDTMTYTDLLGCFLAQPLTYDITRNNYAGVLKDPSYDRLELIEPIRKYFLNRIQDGEKYIQEDFKTSVEINNLIILPGENLIEETVDKNYLIEVMKTEKTFIKPHPLTNDIWINTLEELFPNKILPVNERLYPHFLDAKNIYSVYSSETVINSLLSEKEFKSINLPIQERYGFWIINKALIMANQDIGLSLMRLILNPKSGFFLTTKVQRKISSQLKINNKKDIGIYLKEINKIRNRFK